MNKLPGMHPGRVVQRLISTVIAILLFVGSASSQSSISLDDFDVGDEGSSTGQNVCENAEGCSDTANRSFSLDDVVNLGIIDREEAVVEPASTGGSSDRLSRAIALETIEIDFSDDQETEILSEEQMSAIKQALLNTASNNVKVGVVGRLGDSPTMLKAQNVAEELSERLDLAEGQVEAFGVDGSGPAIQIVIIPLN